MKMPCVKECPNRTAECKLTCEKWKEYEAEYLKERKEKERQREVAENYWRYRERMFDTRRKK